YISARSEPLCALGILAAFLVYIHVPASRRLHLYLIPVVIGTLAKVPAVMFAPLFLSYRLLVEDGLSVREVFSGDAWPRVRKTILSTAPAFALGIFLYYFVHWMQPPGVVYGGGGRIEYLITQTWVWVRYVGLFFLPIGLTADSDLATFSTWRDPRVAAGVILLMASLLAVERASRDRRFRPVAFGILWFWIALIPTSSIFPFGQLTNDHRVFLPFMGLAVAAIGWIAVMAERLVDAVPEWR